jgi:hypothetical protein
MTGFAILVIARYRVVAAVVVKLTSFGTFNSVIAKCAIVFVACTPPRPGTQILAVICFVSSAAVGCVFV